MKSTLTILIIELVIFIWATCVSADVILMFDAVGFLFTLLYFAAMYWPVEEDEVIMTNNRSQLETMARDWALDMYGDASNEEIQSLTNLLERAQKLLVPQKKEDVKVICAHCNGDGTELFEDIIGEWHRLECEKCKGTGKK